VSRDIAPQDIPGALASPGIILTPFSLIVTKPLSDEETRNAWISLMRKLEAIHRSAPFWLGDLLNYTDLAHGDAFYQLIEDALDICDEDPNRLQARLRQYKWVCANVTRDIREEVYRITGQYPSYSMCRAAAGLLDPIAIRDALVYGIEQGLTSREFIRYVYRLKAPSAPPPETFVRIEEDGRIVVEREVPEKDAARAVVRAMVDPSLASALEARDILRAMLEVSKTLPRVPEDKINETSDILVMLCEKALLAISAIITRVTPKEDGENA
jgi:hypothetical protein